MSVSSTANGPGDGPWRGLARVATAVAVAVAVLAPVGVLCAQAWSSTGNTLSFVADERRGVTYLEPLTQLLGATTQAQSAAVAGRPAGAAAIRAAVAAVDQVDARLGGALRTTDRWTIARRTVTDRAARTDWPLASVAYTQYSDLNTALLELNRTVGDNSRLILDPAIDSYYVMNASLLRIPEILVDSGRYTDLRTLAATSGGGDTTGQAQLAAARNRVATDAADLSDGLLEAFSRTGSGTLGPGLTQPLDDFRTAVDAVAPSASLLAPVPDRSPADLASEQQGLARAALDLQQAALGQLDLLLAARQHDQQRSRLIALVATGAGVLVAAGLALLTWRHGPHRPGAEAEPEDRAAAWAQPPAARGRAEAPVEPAIRERAGGARAAG